MYKGMNVKGHESFKIRKNEVNNYREEVRVKENYLLPRYINLICILIIFIHL